MKIALTFAFYNCIFAYSTHLYSPFIAPCVDALDLIGNSRNRKVALNKQCCIVSDSSYIRSTMYVLFFAEYSYPCMVTWITDPNSNTTAILCDDAALITAFPIAIHYIPSTADPGFLDRGFKLTKGCSIC